jgi:hypothetical protein
MCEWRWKAFISSLVWVRLQVRPPAGKLRRANESEYLVENLLFETTLGNYSETNQKQISPKIPRRLGGPLIYINRQLKI